MTEFKADDPCPKCGTALREGYEFDRFGDVSETYSWCDTCQKDPNDPRVVIEWHKPTDKLPENNQECLLLGPADNWGTARVYGPIAWHEPSTCWLDIFASPEAGTMVKPDMIAMWTDWKAIAPEEEEEQ